jgi:hypothetical protein
MPLAGKDFSLAPSHSFGTRFEMKSQNEQAE